MIKNILIGCSLVGLIVLSLFIYHTMFNSKVGYVDIPKVFNGFEMKKEFQEKYKKTEIIRKRVLDSLSMELQLMVKKLNVDNKNKELMDEFEFKREDFYKRKTQVEQDNAALSSQYDKQILEQMSQYILDYGKKNNYDIIMGSDGSGALMYAKDSYNISDVVTNYINDRYKGVE